MISTLVEFLNRLFSADWLFKDEWNRGVQSRILQQPPLKPRILAHEVNWRNNTPLSYNPLPILWNNTLIDAIETQALAVTKQDADKEIGKGNYTDIETGDRGIVADLENNRVVFIFRGYVWKDYIHYKAKRFQSSIIFNAANRSTVGQDHSITKEWEQIGSN